MSTLDDLTYGDCCLNTLAAMCGVIRELGSNPDHAMQTITVGKAVEMIADIIMQTIAEVSS